jgi:acetolactate synthase-1/3 small subunit
METVLHTLSLLVSDHPGVLQRVAGLFGRRGFNIESIAVGPCEQEGCARMTILTPGPEQGIDQVVRQLQKLVDVYEVAAVEAPSIARELMLVRLGMEAGEERTARLRGWLESFPCCRLLDVREDAVVVQLVATRAQNLAFLKLNSDLPALRIVSAGEVALPL